MLPLGFVTRILCFSTVTLMTKVVVLGCIDGIPKVASTTRIVPFTLGNQSAIVGGSLSLVFLGQRGNPIVRMHLHA